MESIPERITKDEPTTAEAKRTGLIDESGVNIQQRMFCHEYLIDYNATRAYMAVYQTKNVNSAKASASRLLTRPNVQNYLQKKSKEILNKLEQKALKREEKLIITKERVIIELARVAFFDVRKLFDEDGNGKSITDLDDDTAAAISGVDISAIYRKDVSLDEKVAEVTKKFKTVNKGQALEILSRHFNIITDSNQINEDIEVIFEDISQQNYANHIPGHNPQNNFRSGIEDDKPDAN